MSNNPTSQPPNNDDPTSDQRLSAAFQLLIENAFDTLLILNIEGVILYASPSVEHLLGYTPQSALGRDANDFVHDDDLTQARQMIQSTLDSNKRSDYTEFRVRHKDGSWRWVEAIAQNLCDHEYIKGIVLNYRDITDRKRTEGALKRSEARYSLAFRSSPDSITISDTQDWTLVEASTAEELDKSESTLDLLIRQARIRDLTVTYADPTRNSPILLKASEIDQVHLNSGDLRLNLEGAINGTPVTMDGTAGTFAKLLDLGEVHYDLRGAIGKMRISTKGQIDSLADPRKPVGHLEISGPDAQYLTDVLGIAPITSGPMPRP